MVLLRGIQGGGGESQCREVCVKKNNNKIILTNRQSLYFSNTKLTSASFEEIELKEIALFSYQIERYKLSKM